MARRKPQMGHARNLGDTHTPPGITFTKPSLATGILNVYLAHGMPAPLVTRTYQNHLVFPPGERNANSWNQTCCTAQTTPKQTQNRSSNTLQAWHPCYFTTSYNFQSRSWFSKYDPQTWDHLWDLYGWKTMDTTDYTLQIGSLFLFFQRFTSWQVFDTYTNYKSGQIRIQNCPDQTS